MQHTASCTSVSFWVLRDLLCAICTHYLFNQPSNCSFSRSHYQEVIGVWDEWGAVPLFPCPGSPQGLLTTPPWISPFLSISTTTAHSQAFIPSPLDPCNKQPPYRFHCLSLKGLTLLLFHPPHSCQNDLSKPQIKLLLLCLISPEVPHHLLENISPLEDDLQGLKWPESEPLHLSPAWTTSPCPAPRPTLQGPRTGSCHLLCVVPALLPFLYAVAFAWKTSSPLFLHLANSYSSFVIIYLSPFLWSLDFFFF